MILTRRGEGAYLALIQPLSNQVLRFLKGSLHWSGAAIADREERPQAPASLPGFSEFRTVLANEYRKASKSQGNLAVVYLDLPDCPSAKREEISKLLLRVTRKDNAIFSPFDSCFALILPGMEKRCAGMLVLGLLELLPTNFPGMFFKLNLAAYPESVSTLDELEAAAPTNSKLSACGS